MYCVSQQNNVSKDEKHENDSDNNESDTSTHYFVRTHGRIPLVQQPGVFMGAQ